jgi:pilus assembly protein Flp/PilA
MLGRLQFVIRSLVKNRRGASSAEYAVAAALISIAAITAMGVVGEEIQNKLGIVANGFN